VRLPPGPPLVWRRPDLLGDGETAFRAGRFYQARELWEAEGLTARGLEGNWIRGLAQIAAGFLKCDENAFSVAERWLFRGLQALHGAPDRVRTVDAAGLKVAAEQLLVALRRGDPADARALAAAA
jgi:hypothetical protein